ncbi:AAA domain-containing protein [Modestobacter sp. SYSU DS0511]
MDDLVAEEPLRALFLDDRGRGAVFVGWPVVVLADAKRALRVAPLLLTQLELPEGATSAVPRDDQPRLNSALVSTAFFPPDAVAVASAAVADGLAFGDPAALVGQLRDVLVALGLDGQVIGAERAGTRQGALSAGVHDRAMAFRGTSDVMTRGLVEELTTLRTRQDWRATAARFLLEQAPAVELEQLSKPAAPLTLNASQEEALAASGSAPVTAVTGPPGTGKSQLVAAIVAGAWLRGETVLVTSTNNQAVRAAVEKAHAVDDGALVRTGNRDHREALPAVLRELAARPAFTGPSPEVGRRRLDLAIERRTALHDRLAARAALEGELAQLALDLEQQRTVLWGTAEPSPVHDRRAELATRARRAGRAWWFRRARQQRVLASAQLSADPGVTVTDLAAWAEGEIRWDQAHQQLAGHEPRDGEAERAELAAADQEWAAACRDVVRRAVSARLAAGRTALHQLADMRPGARDARAAALTRALPHAAGWACTALSARSNFSLTAGLFDLLVVDEASQCSVADVLPMAYRAKRIVVVGDPNQLAPVVTPSKQDLAAVAASVGADEDAMHEAKVSYGRDSAFAGFDHRAGRSPYLLAEHYRCHPEIAAYVNEAFYGGDLRVLTDPSTAGDGLQGLHWVQVDGRTDAGPRGGAYNRAEADAVVRWVVEHGGEAGTLGVVTPFAAQADLIRRGLEQAVSEEQRRARELVVGTAHRLQGGERDIVLFSTVLSAGANPRTTRWVERERNLINVAVSRAKRALVVVGDARALTDLEAPTLQALVSASRRVPGRSTDDLREDPRLHSEAERRLFAALRAVGADVVPKLVESGYELDFAIRQADGRRIDVECDGSQHLDPRGRQRRQDLAQDAVIERLGWQVVRVPAWRCLAEPHQVAQEITSA